jgi:hypothetical protein
MQEFAISKNYSGVATAEPPQREGRPPPEPTPSTAEGRTLGLRPSRTVPVAKNIPFTPLPASLFICILLALDTHVLIYRLLRITVCAVSFVLGYCKYRNSVTASRAEH